LNIIGELGVGSTSVDPTSSTPPIPVSLADDTHDWQQVTTQFNSTCVVSSDGMLACTGRNNQGQLANGDFTERTSLTSASGSGWQSVSMGFQYACGIRNSELYCWGSNFDGVLGHADGLSPREVVVLP
jgi:alpha-tubulin suppressor-like RCC1 family protein